MKHHAMNYEIPPNGIDLLTSKLASELFKSVEAELDKNPNATFLDVLNSLEKEAEAGTKKQGMASLSAMGMLTAFRLMRKVYERTAQSRADNNTEAS